MPHYGIYGISECGKSILSRHMAACYRRQKVKVGVFDPLRTRWDVDFAARSLPELYDHAYNLHEKGADHGWAFFIDECGHPAVKDHPELTQWFATMSRHWGHSTHFIAQRSVMIPPNIRDMVTRLYLFCCSKNDAKIHAEEFNKEELETAYLLPVGNFFRASRFEGLQRGHIDFPKKKVLIYASVDN